VLINPWFSKLRIGQEGEVSVFLFVGVVGFGDSSVDLVVRPTALSEHYWDVYYQANEAIKKALDDNNKEITYPHQVEIRKMV
jgi:small conductance mechanosensitive channel|tara:strand:+ start:4701 stop:4946 length:246 start_codon:yes stop_codon:yes gene_type:complete